MQSNLKDRAMRGLDAAHSRVYPVLARLSTTGVVTAAIAWCISLAPSLIPRGWLFQAVITGIVAAVGYGFGAALGGFARWLGFETPWSNHVRSILWRIFIPLAVFGIVASAYFGAKYQTELRNLLGVEANGPSKFVWQALISLSLIAAILAIARLLRRIGKWVTAKLNRWIPYRAAVLCAVIIVAVASATLVDGTLVRGSMSLLNNLYEHSDKNSPRDAVQPASANRSGSTASLSEWDSLGYQGRAFVSGGPSESELEDFAEHTASLKPESVRDPIRVYAGLSEERDLDKTAAQVVAELNRTDAWDREALLVATATGTGWIDPSASSSFEYLFGGDTAIASMQYSYLPSGVAFLTDRDTPPAAGKALMEAVYEAWLEQPEDHRPKLYVFGLSLGSYGMQGAFSGLQDINERTDGALFVGTPNFTPQWSFFTSNRAPSSPEVAPVFDGGKQVRFSAQANGASALWDLDSEWKSPRVAYVQHASDAVVWWSPNLIWNSPDWIKENSNEIRPTPMRWFPIVTFLQVSFDMFVSGDVPAGHGHMYVREYADAFAAITGQDQWSSSDLELLKDRVQFGPENQ